MTTLHGQYTTYDLYASHANRTEQPVDQLIQSLYVTTTKHTPVQPAGRARSNSKPNLYTSRPNTATHYHRSSISAVKHADTTSEEKSNEQQNGGLTLADDVAVRTIVQQYKSQQQENARLDAQLHAYRVQADVLHNQRSQSLYHTNQLTKQTYKRHTETNDTVDTTTGTGTDLQTPLRIWSLQSQVAAQQAAKAKLRSRPATAAKRPVGSADKRNVKPVKPVNPLASTATETPPLDNIINSIKPTTSQYRPLRSATGRRTAPPPTTKAYRPQSAAYATNVLLHKLQSSNIQCNAPAVYEMLQSVDSRTQHTPHADTDHTSHSATMPRPQSAPMRLPKHPFQTQTRVQSAGKKTKKRVKKT